MKNYSLFIETDHEDLAQDIVQQYQEASKYKNKSAYPNVFDMYKDEDIYVITINNANPYILICSALTIKSAIVDKLNQINYLLIEIGKDLVTHKDFNRTKVSKLNDILSNNKLTKDQCEYYYEKYYKKAIR